MNLRIYLIGLFIALAGFTACSDDVNADIEQPGDGQETTDPAQEKNVLVSIKLPGTDAVPYSDIAQNDELVLDTITAYAFIDANAIGGDNYEFYRRYHFPAAGVVSVGNSITLTLPINNTSKDMRFYFVANHQGTLSLNNIPDEDAFRAALTNQSFQGVKAVNSDAVAPLMMTTDSCRITADGLQADNPALSGLEFRRVMTRIDIMNRKRNFAIDSVKMLNAPTKSLVYNKADAGAWTFAEDLFAAVTRANMPGVKIDDALRYPPMQVGSPTEGKDSIHMQGIIYPFEGPIIDPNGVSNNQSIRLYGRIDPEAAINDPDFSTGLPVVYDLDLSKGFGNTANKEALLRNNRYILLIENSVAHDMEYTFNVVDWENDTDTLKHDMDPDIRIYNNGTNLTNGAANLVVGATENTYRIDVSSNTEWEVLIENNDLSWVTISTPPTAEADSPTPTIGSYFVLAVTRNVADAERRATIVIRSKVQNIAYEAEFNIVQDAQ